MVTKWTDNENSYISHMEIYIRYLHQATAKTYHHVLQFMFLDSLCSLCVAANSVACTYSTLRSVLLPRYLGTRPDFKYLCISE